MTRRVAHFALVGIVGFAIDTSVFTTLYYSIELPLMYSRGLAFVCAATTTWYGNRILTFSTGMIKQPKLRQWAKSMGSASLSAVPNLMVFKLTTIALGTGDVVIFGALLLGVGVGMVSNYLLNCFWVFSAT